MPEPYLGEIRLFAGNYPPVGWLFCQGQALPIGEYDTLFNLIGTTYGGDGVNYFNLPNLASRVPFHVGQSAGGSYFALGQVGGVEQVTLTAVQAANHNHPLACSAAGGSGNAPGGAVLASTSAPLYTTLPPDGAMAPQSVGPAGGGLPHENRPPFLVLSFIIAVQGIFPTRS